MFTPLDGQSHQTSVALFTTEPALSFSGDFFFLCLCGAAETKHLVKSLYSNTQTIHTAFVLPDKNVEYGLLYLFCGDPWHYSEYIKGMNRVSCCLAKPSSEFSLTVI